MRCPVVQLGDARLDDPWIGWLVVRFADACGPLLPSDGSPMRMGLVPLRHRLKRLEADELHRRTTGRCHPQRLCGPRISLPGIVPVASPSSKIACPDLIVIL